MEQKNFNLLNDLCGHFSLDHDRILRGEMDGWVQEYEGRFQNIFIVSD